TAALRLLRPGGVVAFDNALWGGRVATPSCTDPETSAIREVVEAVRQDDRLVPLLLPLGDGLLTPVKRGWARGASAAAAGCRIRWRPCPGRRGRTGRRPQCPGAPRDGRR